MYSKKIKSLILFLAVIIAIIAASVYSLSLLETTHLSAKTTLIIKVIQYVIIFSISSTILLTFGQILKHLMMQVNQEIKKSNKVEKSNN